MNAINSIFTIGFIFLVIGIGLLIANSKSQNKDKKELYEYLAEVCFMVFLAMVIFYVLFYKI